jgi:hypothetical protein
MTTPNNKILDFPMWNAKDGQIYNAKTGNTIAVLINFDEQNEDHAKIQKLIAAAPELLQYLKERQEDEEEKNNGTIRTFLNSLNLNDI